MRIFSSKPKVALATLVAVFGVALVPVVHAAVQFGPDRPTYTWNSPSDHITFNSITNNPDPSIGDERTFVSARDAASSDMLTYSKNLTVHDNEEVLVRVFYHNDAGENLNLVATNTKVKVALPSGSSTAPQIAAYISADNATPSMVWSTMDISAGGQPFTMEYISGTAQLWNQAQNGTALSDSVVSSGAQIGFNQIDGKIPGCSKFSGYVTIKVRVHVASTVQPVYSCDALHVTSLGNRSFKYKVDATAKNGATITGYTFDFGDGNSVNTTSNSTSHTYGKDGTYTTTATVKFNVGGSEKSAACSQTIKISTKKPVTPVVSAATTKTLPNTGPGDVLGIFSGVSALGAAGHYITRRFRRG